MILVYGIPNISVLDYVVNIPNVMVSIPYEVVSISDDENQAPKMD